MPFPFSPPIGRAGRGKLNSPSGDEPAPPAAFHSDSDALRFWVLTPNRQVVGASLSRSTLHYRFKGQADGSDAVAVYQANRAEIDAAVLRRVAGGSREPVMLREHDLPINGAR